MCVHLSHVCTSHACISCSSPRQAIGAISLLEHRDGSSLTINVEYNQLDPLLRYGRQGVWGQGRIILTANADHPLLRATINKDGDVNDSTGVD